MWSGSLQVGNINADVKPEEMVYIVTALLLLWCDDEILLISKRTTVQSITDHQNQVQVPR